jgi:hypothetical protein
MHIHPDLLFLQSHPYLKRHLADALAKHWGIKSYRTSKLTRIQHQRP